MKDNGLFNRRLAELQSHLQTHQAWLIATPSHITYLTNFHFLVPEEKEALLIVTRQRAVLIHASFCPVGEVASNVEKLTQTQGEALRQHLNEIMRQQPQLTEWFLDENLLSITEYKIMLSFPDITLKTLDHQLIWQQRMIKNQTEQRLCQQAGQIAHQAFRQVMEIIRAGMSELQIKNLLDNLMVDLGADKSAFPTIVAFGPNSALPHHQPNQQPLTHNTAILFDFGAMVQGYRSDMTRTIWFGDQLAEEFTKIEQVVQQAYQQALTRVQQEFTSKKQPTLTARDLDIAAREVITQAGFNKEFIHTTGHGVGLDIHEPPSLNWKNDTQIKAGMIITLEPGIYLADRFGYRYENTISVTPTSALELTT